MTPAELVARARERAEVTRYRAHPSSGAYLRGVLVHSTDAASRLGLAETEAIDGYLAAGDVANVVRSHGLTVMTRAGLRCARRPWIWK